tara:strand:+ start:305 stop:799 length:495 start_codon:yes stop_codon:yes gene_type:complete
MSKEDAVDVVDKAMASTAAMFTEISALLKGNGVPSRTQLENWKRLAAKSNKSIAKSTRLFWAKDDRARIENSLLKQAMASERLDRDANCARFLEKLRSHSNIASADLDRACGAAAQVQVVLSQLAPVPNTSYHGSAFLALSYNGATPEVTPATQSTAPSPPTGT